MDVLSRPRVGRMERLEDIALNACYRDVISSLFLCRDFWTTGQYNPFSYSSVLALNQAHTSDNMIRYLRLKLDCFLAGTVSDEVRRKLVDRFMEDEENNSFRDVKDIKWAFLASVLDEGFSDLEICIDSPVGDVNSKILAAVTKHSPFLNKLTLDFSHVKSHHLQGTRWTAHLKANLLPISNLNNLSVLSVKHMDDGEITEYLAYLGTWCPSLVNLSLKHTPLKLRDILNIFLGENAGTVEIDEEFLHEYQFVPEMLVPFCNTLTSIQLEHHEENKLSDSDLEPSAIAFILRHVRNLVSLSVPGRLLCNAVKKLLYTSFREYGSTGNCRPIVKDYAKRSPFKGTLLLENLGWLDISDEQMVVAARHLCPLLKKVRLLGSLHDINLDHSTNPLSPSLIKNIWPQLQYLTLCNVNEKNQKTLINQFGHRLLGIHFADCRPVNLDCLAQCTGLEELEIDHQCSLDSWETEPERFLPSLKKIHCDICLGQMSGSFLKRPTLSEIQLECFNLVTEAKEWSSIKKLWPHLKSFYITKCEGLDSCSVERIFPSFGHLKTLVLPRSMRNMKVERHLLDSLADKFKSRKINLSFEAPFDSSKCCHIKYPEPYESSQAGGSGGWDSDPDYDEFADVYELDSDYGVDYDDDYEGYDDAADYAQWDTDD